MDRNVGSEDTSMPRKPVDRQAATFTMLWPSDYVKAIRKRHREHPEPLHFLWGGHNLQTRFKYYGVRPGDTVYPVFIAKKQLYLVGRMTVTAVSDLKSYLADHPRDASYVYHGCANEALAGTHGTLLHFDLPVPRDMLEGWRFLANRGERSIKRLIDGMVTLALPFQGTYRVTPATATALFHLLLEHEAAKQLVSRRSPAG